MSEAWYAFQSCGWPAWICLLLGILAAPLALGALLAGLLRSSWSRLLAWAALGVSLAPPAMGAIGQQRGRALTDSVIDSPAVDPEVRERIREEGYKEAAACLTVGGVTGAVPLAFALGALAFAYTRPKEQRE